MKPAYGYSRVSTTTQAIEGVSLAAQEAAIVKWCEANNRELIQVFRDEGISAKRSDNRPGLQDALKAACAVRGAAFVCYSLSRMSRSIKDCIELSERLNKHKCDLILISGNIDTTTAAGRLYFHMIAAMDQMIREQTGENTSAALQHMQANGKRVSRFPPYGYDFDGDRLVRNITEQAWIEWMRTQRQHFSYNGIAHILNTKCVPTKTGKRWTHSQISRILTRAEIVVD